MTKTVITDMKDLHISNPYAEAFRSESCPLEDADKRCCFIAAADLIPKCKHFSFDDDHPYCEAR